MNLRRAGGVDFPGASFHYFPKIFDKIHEVPSIVVFSMDKISK